MLLQTDFTRLNRPEQIGHVKEWVKGRAECNGLPGLLLHGETSGAGKTRTGTWAFLELVGQSWEGSRLEREDIAMDGGQVGLWYNVLGFQQKYQQCMLDSKAKAGWLRQLSRAFILYLDDIGKLRGTPGMQELLFSVLDERLPHGALTTILTTNFCGDALIDRWGPDYGPYLVRRLKEFSLTLDFG
jgi:hypothetical protein